MSLEPGGRSEKYGDEYENRYLAKLLLRLVCEELTSIIVEPIGENSDSVEFIAERKDGISAYYQCKASNGSHESWSVADLKRYAVFSRAKTILTDNTNSHYYFISPLSYNELDELCKRARTTPSAEDLMKYQLANKTIRSTFNDCVRAFNLDVSNTDDQEKLVYLLSHCDFERFSGGNENVRDLEEHIHLLFTGKASTVRVLLEHFANDTGKYGVSITAKEVVDYLEKSDIHPRNMNYDERILPRITELNKNYWDPCPLINGKLIPREATSRIIQRINESGSVILHGKAGCGKSGCLQETIAQLESEHILYLAIKLDKFTPESSADEFGRKLGLPNSPVYCLATLAGESPCVLILDQLDALRWNMNHSAEALSVCKELIGQAESFNKFEGKSISIVFASRTFDLENDSGLKNLFNDERSQNALEWEKICVDVFTKNEVIDLIGSSYNNLSSRLQKLLLTPSSLYVWTQLEESRKTNSVSTVHQLMQEWWHQLQEKAETYGVSHKTINECKDSIVNRMEKYSCFSLPISIFVDQHLSLSILISQGMIRNDGKHISFVHQSFLDFFITSDHLSKIYDGTSIDELLVPYDEQTPQIRYRLVSVLQNLIESDQNMFVLQARRILDSSAIHFYYQCAVFEVIGQCDTPNESVFSFVDQYASQQNWKSYIIQTVFSAHPVYIRHWAEKDCSWLEETKLALLRTISNKDPDFVVEMLSPYEIRAIEDARKIHWALCFDAADDSEKMFQLRAGLYKKYPELLDSFFGFSHLITRHAERAICLLRMIVESSNEYRFQHIYLGEKREIHAFAATYYESITKSLIPAICKETSSLTIAWPYYRSFGDKEYEDWFSSRYEKSVLRQIVDLVKMAIDEYSKKQPDAICSFMEQVPFLSSAIGHELFAYTLSCLPEAFGDYAIQWLLSSFDENVFVFTDQQEDYLAYTKRILQKFSSSCIFGLFQNLEHTICAWKDSDERMCNIYKHRIDVNKRYCHHPVFYAYWGHMQKELLPCLDSKRLSPRAKELVLVLQRNPWVQTPHFNSGIGIGSLKTVISPIERNTAQISDKRWLEIISTPNEKMKDHAFKEDDQCYIEANHPAFSDSLRKQAKHEPARFARLSLAFPEGCYEGYITGVLYALEDTSEDKNPVDFELVCNVIRRYMTKTDISISIAIARIVKYRAEEAWPDDILNHIELLATTHPDPEEDGFSVTKTDDPNHQSVSSLQNNEINCTRGCATHAIAALLWEHSELVERFKPAIVHLCMDKNPAVRFAALQCLLPYYNSDSVFSVTGLNLLLNTDLRIIGAHGFWDLMFREYQNRQHYYRGKLLKACQSDIEDLSMTAAGMLCAIAIFCGDDYAYEAMETIDLSADQQDEICKQAISSFNEARFHERSEIIILDMLERADGRIPCLGQLFYQKCISIQRDSDFLIKLMRSEHCHELLYPFLRYLNESDEEICQYVYVLKTLAKSLAITPNHERDLLSIEDLVQCVIRLSDRGKDNAQIRVTCLDIWDNLFRSQLNSLKPMSDMIDNFE